MIGQSLAYSSLKDYVLNYKLKKKKICLLLGPIGTGKTKAVYEVAKELDYELHELNSSDLRNEKSITSFLSSTLGQQSLFGKKKIILIDEVDNLSRKDRGCVNALLKAAAKSTFPIICTANEEVKKLKKEQIIHFNAIHYKDIATHLQAICEKNNITFEGRALAALARQADGDLRAAEIDLQVLKNNLTLPEVTALPSRRRTREVKEALLLIFKSSSATPALSALDNLGLDMDKLFLWVDYNLPFEYTKANDLKNAYQHLARADIFRARIRRRQYWRLLAYINQLLTAGISTAKEEKYTKPITYKQSSRLLKIWQANRRHATKKAIAQKVAEHLSISKQRAEQELPYLKKLIPGAIELTDDELDWLKTN